MPRYSNTYCSTWWLHQILISDTYYFFFFYFENFVIYLYQYMSFVHWISFNSNDSFMVLHCLQTAVYIHCGISLEIYIHRVFEKENLNFIAVKKIRMYKLSNCTHSNFKMYFCIVLVHKYYVRFNKMLWILTFWRSLWFSSTSREKGYLRETGVEGWIILNQKWENATEPGIKPETFPLLEGRSIIWAISVRLPSSQIMVEELLYRSFQLIPWRRNFLSHFSSLRYAECDEGPTHIMLICTCQIIVPR